MRELELYVHLPFCARKCLYCDFLSFPADPSVQDAYLKRLLEEIRTLAPDYGAYTVSSVYIGGGTPSLLAPLSIEWLTDALFQNFAIAKDAEITMECNPGTVNGGKARIMHKAGINRISFGLQSVHNGELKLLGRIHTYEDFLLSFGEARKAGFTNLNVDLISALPGQTVGDWKETLKKTVMLRPEHISAYSLIIEEGTPFYARYHEDELARDRGENPVLLPTEEEERQMDDETADILSAHGYRRYEISNYAREGCECRHNIGYWTGAEYLGLGLGAASLVDNTRFRNTDQLQEYMEQPFSRRGEERRDQKAAMEEFMFLGLRMTCGISRKEFLARFGKEIESIYGDVLPALKEEGLLAADAGRIFLTPRGMEVSNRVLARFLL